MSGSASQHWEEKSREQAASVPTGGTPAQPSVVVTPDEVAPATRQRRQRRAPKRLRDEAAFPGKSPPGTGRGGRPRKVPAGGLEQPKRGRGRPWRSGGRCCGRRVGA